jgi:hypothetical protein
MRIDEIKSGYSEIEFVCVNPGSPDATDADSQEQLYFELKKIPGVIPLWQDWSDHSEGQTSLTAIFKTTDRNTKNSILNIAKKLQVEVDLEQEVSDDYIDRAIKGEHEGQIVK